VDQVTGFLGNNLLSLNLQHPVTNDNKIDIESILKSSNWCRTMLIQHQFHCHFSLSRDSEYIMADECCKELVYLKSLLEELLNINIKIILNMDN